MEKPTVTGLRSRSRSKTPFLRSSCDREQCAESEDHTHHKSGRKTPVKRSTPVKQLQPNAPKTTAEIILEADNENESPPAHHTRHSTRIIEKTMEYSSDEGQNRIKGHRKEIFQNELNSQYERVSTSSRGYSTLADVTLSPIVLQNVTRDRSFRLGSPTHSACSTDSSFAEQALADTSVLLDKDPTVEHLPYRLYKMAGEYWNKYPKTDYTYSPMSRDRVELAPGQVAVPNMSRRSLSQFRVQGPNISADEIDKLTMWKTSSVRQRFTTVESSDDESSYLHGNGGFRPAHQHWWITQLLITMVTTITTTTSSTYRKIFGPSHRYPYTDRRPTEAGILYRASSAALAPFYWIYTLIKKVLTTTVTTVVETITPNHVEQTKAYAAYSHESKQYKESSSRRYWPWLLLLLLPIFGYGSHYTYENWDHLAIPNLTDFQLDLSEFTTVQLSKISLPNITLPTFNITMPDINITLPDIRDNLPEMSEVTKTYKEYKDIVQNRMLDASDYMKVVAESCFEEIRRFWSGIIG